MTEKRLSAYRIMWLFVFFDLPVSTKRERKAASTFRKRLLKNGFTMMQFSVYNRHCASGESADVYCKRIKKMLPASGHIVVLRITDKQFSKMLHFYGKLPKPPPPSPQQLELF